MIGALIRGIVWFVTNRARPQRLCFCCDTLTREHMPIGKLRVAVCQECQAQLLSTEAMFAKAREQAAQWSLR